MEEKSSSIRHSQRQPRQKQIDLTDAEILDRGLEAFAELSYSGASVRELAKRMAVSHNFINDRFGSKANFWRAVMDNAIAQPYGEMMAIFGSDVDDVEKFTSFVKVFYRLSTNRPYINRIISDESALDSDRLDYLYRNYTGPILAEIELLAQRLMRAGRIPEISMDVLYSALTGPAIILSQQQMGRRIRGIEDLSPTEWERTTDTLTDVIIRGLLI
ncbi:TetR/AcrR family transcriptional regulator [Streptomyces sp. NPDC059718]